MIYFITGILVGSSIGYLIGCIKTRAYCTRELENMVMPILEKLK